MCVHVTTSLCVQNGKMDRQLQIFEILRILRPKQNGAHFANDIFKCRSVTENGWVSIKISLNNVPNRPINSTLLPALVQVLDCLLSGSKPLPKPMLPGFQLDPWEQTTVKFELKLKKSFIKMRVKSVICEVAAFLSRGGGGGGVNNHPTMVGIMFWCRSVTNVSTGYDELKDICVV